MIISTIFYLQSGSYNKTIKEKAVIPMIDFTPLWNTMKERQVSQYQLLKSGIDNKTLDGLKKNKNITLATVEKLCNILNCEPNDIVRFIDCDTKEE